MITRHNKVEFMPFNIFILVVVVIMFTFGIGGIASDSGFSRFLGTLWLMGAVFTATGIANGPRNLYRHMKYTREMADYDDLDEELAELINISETLSGGLKAKLQGKAGLARELISKIPERSVRHWLDGWNSHLFVLGRAYQRYCDAKGLHASVLKRLHEAKSEEARELLAEADTLVRRMRRSPRFKNSEGLKAIEKHRVELADINGNPCVEDIRAIQMHIDMMRPLVRTIADALPKPKKS